MMLLNKWKELETVPKLKNREDPPSLFEGKPLIRPATIPPMNSAARLDNAHQTMVPVIILLVSAALGRLM